MKNKKFISLVLALAMIFTMSVSVFATSGTTDKNTFKATAEVKIPAIDVTVPTSQNLFINPMGFDVLIKTGAAADADTVAADKTNSKIVSPVFAISNTSPMKLDVNVIGSVTPAETNKALTIVTAPISSEDTKNSVFIYVQFGEATGADGEEKFKTAPGAYEVPEETAETFPQLALTTKVPTKPVNVGTVDKAGKLGFQFLGDCNANAKLDWNATDKVEVNLIFSFKPHVETAAASDNG